MSESVIKPFLWGYCKDLKILANWVGEMDTSFWNLSIAEEITTAIRKRSKLLYLGGHSFKFSLPDAQIEDITDKRIDFYKVLVDRLNAYFTPKQNSSFESNLFRSLGPTEGETFAKFVLSLRH